MTAMPKQRPAPWDGGSRDQPQSPSQPAQHFLDFLPSEDERQANGALGPRRVLQPLQLPPEHLPEQEQEGAECLVLCRGADSEARRQASEERSDLADPKRAGSR